MSTNSTGAPSRQLINPDHIAKSLAAIEAFEPFDNWERPIMLKAVSDIADCDGYFPALSISTHALGKIDLSRKEQRAFAKTILKLDL